MQNTQAILNLKFDRRRKLLLKRVFDAGKFLVTPLLVEEFSQMTVEECNTYVQGVEKYFRNLSVSPTPH